MRIPEILLIYTGGTIGSIEDPETGALRPVDFDQLTDFIPELQRLEVKLGVETLREPKDSSDIRPSDWQELVRIIEKNYDAYDGFVVLHGTDTLAYTASALSFMIEHLDKPVIFTGSQLPMGKIRTDGKENLLTAIEIASALDDDGRPRVPEVAVYFEYKLYRANRCFKYSAHHFNAYKSPNYPLLAEAGVYITYNEQAIRKVPENTTPVFYKDIDSQVFVLTIFPGISRQTFEIVGSMEGLRTLIIQTFGTGNGPLDPSFFQMLQACIAREVVVVNITQCREGSVIPGYYATGIEMSRPGVVNGKDMTMEAAITKAMVLGGRYLRYAELFREMGKPFCGEMD